MDAQTKHARSQRLIELSEEKRKAHYAAHIGTERPVLWEHAKEGEPLSGFTDNYIKVTQAQGCEAEDNTLSVVRLGDFTEDQETLWATQA